MKKLFCLILTCIAIFTCSSCSAGENQTGENQTGENQTEYLMSIGTKIDSLSKEDQDAISAYVSDCKTYLIEWYKEFNAENDHLDIDPYIVFTEVFVYDFRNCNVNSEESDDIWFWEYIKKLRADEKLPIIYIELQGYINYLGNELYTLNNLWNNGIFIYDENTAIPYPHKSITQATMIFSYPTGTEFINCGNRFSEEFTSEAIVNYNEPLKTLSPYQS